MKKGLEERVLAVGNREAEVLAERERVVEEERNLEMESEAAIAVCACLTENEKVCTVCVWVILVWVGDLGGGSNEGLRCLPRFGCDFLGYSFVWAFWVQQI